VLYYGVNIGEVYFRYYRLLDENADGNPHRVRTRRWDDPAPHPGRDRRRSAFPIPLVAASSRSVATAQPREIVIETRYSESVSLPFFNHSFSFHPRAVQPL